MKIFYSHFHSSALAFQLPNHSLYPRIDWSKVEAGNYAVVDPCDSHAILYMSDKAYEIQVRVSLSTDSRLVVLARPGDKPVTIGSSSSHSSSSDSSQNSPIPKINKLNSQKWRSFLNWHLSTLGSLRKIKKSTKGGAKSSGDRSAMVVISVEVLRTLMPYWGLDLHFRLGGPCLPSRALVKALRDMSEDMASCFLHEGAQTLINKMKACLFLLNRYLAGNKNDDPWLLDFPVGLSRSGLPRLIPSEIRSRILSGDLKAIRMMTSIFNAYKAMEGTHKESDLASVVGSNPLNEDDPALLDFKRFCEETFWSKVVKSYIRQDLWLKIKAPDFSVSEQSTTPVYIPLRAGPNGRTGLFSAPVDAWAWHLQPVNWLEEWCKHVGDLRTLKLYRSTLEKVDADLVNHIMTPVKGGSPVQVHTGKLGLLPEPAGKVRIIAMVDYWTQRVMAPMHDWMMKILSHLPTDSTFNQEESLRSFAARVKTTRATCHSIDLKSATDMIPISLYRVVFGSILGYETTDLWISLLTDREFCVPNDSLVSKELRGRTVRYGRGQPMGTLSSWPSMAIVHHALELYSAFKAGLDPALFVDYRILGDDNVTGNTPVAESYREVAAALCVPTSSTKTISGSAFIYASQVYNTEGENLSPLSLKEELGIRTVAQRLEMALRAIRRGWLDTGNSIPRFLRLLLSQKDYGKSLRSWSRGELGRIAQSALISAFGSLGSSLRDLLGFRGSNMNTLLNALAYKVQALAGDQSSKELGKLIGSDPDKILRAYAIVLSSEMNKELQRELDRIRLAGIRFRQWSDFIKEVGFLPVNHWGARLNTPKKGPPLPGFPAMVLEGFASHGSKRHRDELTTWSSGREFSQRPCGPLTYEDSMLSRSHLALWPVIHDSFLSMFGVATVDPSTADATLIINDDWELPEEDDGCGVTFTPDETTIVNPGGGATETPGAEITIDRCIQRSRDIVATLRDSSSGLMQPLEELADLSAVLSEIKRTPDFTALASFYPKEIRYDTLSPFVRHMRVLAKVNAVVPFSLNFKKEILREDIPSGAAGIEQAYTALDKLMLDPSILRSG